LIEDGTLVRWNNSSYITAQRETGSAEGRKEEGCRDNNLKKWYHAGWEQNSYDSEEWFQ
jgi:hypothetical protein